MPLVGPNGAPLDGGSIQPQPDPAAPPAPQPVLTAFLAVQLPDGRWVAVADLNAPIVPQRVPMPDDLIAGASVIAADMTARRAADMAATQTIQTQLAMQRQMQAQQLSPAEAAAAQASMQAFGRTQ